ncbi:MAG: hypothetical protein PHX61_12370 [Alphaproteobacteria bacterium]|nr:hypothetical protein [Alphaproteobacteria bacterium]
MDTQPKGDKKKVSNTTSNFLQKVRDGVNSFADSIRHNNDLYDESIKAIKSWEQHENERLEKIEEKIELRYGGDVIDADLLQRKEEVKKKENDNKERMRKEEAELQAIQQRVNDLLKKEK